MRALTLTVLLFFQFTFNVSHLQFILKLFFLLLGAFSFFKIFIPLLVKVRSETKDV